MWHAILMAGKYSVSLWTNYQMIAKAAGKDSAFGTQIVYQPLAFIWFMPTAQRAWMQLQL